MRAVRLLLVVTILGVLLATPGVAAAADPTPASLGTVRFAAGTHVGYRFDSSGAVIASKRATLAGPSSAATTARVAIAGKGMYIRVANGIWAGYLVPERPTSYVVGIVGVKTYSPIARLGFPAGTYLGYTFDSAWNMTSAKRGVLSAASGAHTDRRAVINGTTYYRVVDGIWANRWVPGSNGLPKSLDCRAGNRVAAGSMQVFSRIPNAGHAVALTFDMGGRVDPAMSIMRYLLLHRVCTTIFPTGAMSQTAVGGQVLALIRAHPELFEVGNHTMHHCDLANGGGGSPSTAPCPTSRPTTAFMQKELTDAAAIIATGTGQRPVPYWRPPYGSYDAGVLNAAASVGYTKTLMWDIDTIDWRPVAEGGPTAAQIAAKVVSNAADGTDVLMHLGGWNTYNALPSMIYGLRARGFVLTSISDMLN